jgi:hypothetical protein
LDDANLNRFGTSSPAQGSGDRAQNWVNWLDASAYLDWSGLRPMSEFEYEKMCRGNDVTYGPIYPINGEFAWGNVSLTSIAVGALAGAGPADNTTSEGLLNPSTNQANAHTANVVLNAAAVAGNHSGPVISGIFAAKNFTTEQRRQAGASFYGVMELTGNVREFVVMASTSRSSCYGNSYASPFTASIHGNGIIPSGASDINTWLNNATNSGTNQTLLSYSGGSFVQGAWRVSQREIYSTSSCTSSNLIHSAPNNRTNEHGIRGVRSIFN